MILQNVNRIQVVAIAATCVSLGFGAGLIWPKATKVEKEQISISADALALQISERSGLMGRDLSDDEIAKITDRQVAYEVMVREAAHLEVHLKDADIRKHMVSVMQYIMSTNTREPTEAELSAFLSENSDRYMTPRKFTFEHVFFAENPDKAQQLYQVVRAGGDVPSDAGDVFWLGSRMEQYSSNQLLTLLGHKFVKAVREMPLKQWSPPIQSARGTHIVKLHKIHEPIPLPPDEMHARLRSDWKKRHQAAVFDNEIERLSASYEIVLPDEAALSEAVVRHDEKALSKWASAAPRDGE